MTVSTAKSKRIVLLYPDEDGYTIAEVPSLPGCISQGETREEALENIQEAIALHLEVLQERGEFIPEDQIEITSVLDGLRARNRRGCVAVQYFKSQA